MPSSRSSINSNRRRRMTRTAIPRSKARRPHSLRRAKNLASSSSSSPTRKITGSFGARAIGSRETGTKEWEVASMHPHRRPYQNQPHAGKSRHSQKSSAIQATLASCTTWPDYRNFTYLMAQPVTSPRDDDRIARFLPQSRDSRNRQVHKELVGVTQSSASHRDRGSIH